MAQSTQEKEEWQVANHLLAHLDLATTPIVKAETPDFILTVNQQEIGVEITAYHQGVVARGGAPRREAERHWDLFRDEANAYRKGRPDLEKLHVLLTFRDETNLPNRMERGPFIREVEQYAAGLGDQIDGELREFPPPTFKPSSLLQRYLRSLYLSRPGAWMEWDWNGDVGSVGVTEPELLEIIQRKANRPYKTLHELWLVIYGSVSLSRAMYTFGVGRLNGFGDLGRELSASPFQRVYLIGCDEEVFVWTRETDSWSVDERRTVGSPSSR